MATSKKRLTAGAPTQHKCKQNGRLSSGFPIFSMISAVKSFSDFLLVANCFNRIEPCCLHRGVYAKHQPHCD
jgi:hypothetical protein